MFNIFFVVYIKNGWICFLLSKIVWIIVLVSGVCVVLSILSWVER